MCIRDRSSPVRVLPTETASGAGTLTLEDAEAPIKPAIPLDGGASAAQELTLDAITTPQEPAPTAVTPAPVELAEDEGETTVGVGVAETGTEKACFELMTVGLTDSTLIDPVMSDAMFAGDIGACITPDLIGSALERLNGYFLDAGFVTTRAYITPQDLSTGTLAFTVVEGTIEDIRLNGDSAEDKRRIRMAFAAQPGDCLLYTSPSPRDATLSRMPSSA